MRWLSHSQVSQYERCPWSWYASKILKLSRPPVEPFAFGRAVHAAMAAYWIDNENWPKVLKSTMDQEYKDLDLSEPGFGKEIDKAEILSRYEHSGLALIQMMTDQIRGTFAQIETIAVERKAKKVGFVGYIDWRGTLDEIEYILDWKTSNKPWKNPEKSAHEDDQLTCYAALSGVRNVGYGVMVRSDGSTRFSLSARTNDQISRYWDKVDKIRTEMNSGVCKPCEDWYCNWCAYQNQCPAKGDF